MKFRAVIFDLFGTLVEDFASSVGQMHAELAAALGVPCAPFMQLWQRTSEMRTIGAFQTVEASIEYVCADMGARVTPEQMNEAVQIRLEYIRRALAPRRDAIETLAELKRRGSRIGLISNCSIEIPIVWEDTVFAGVIDAPVFSSRERVKKPESGIYRLACERLGVGPDASCYIADGEDHELSGAAKLGLFPVLIRTAAQSSKGPARPEAQDWRGAAIGSVAEVLRIV